MNLLTSPPTTTDAGATVARKHRRRPLRRLTDTLRAELVLLRRRRLWLVVGAITVVYTVAATTLTLMTVVDRPGGAELSRTAVAGAGGATAGVLFAIAFAPVLVLASFTSSTANEFGRGTLRAAMSRQPGRLSLITGKFLARFAVGAVLMLLAMVIGAVTAAVIAPTQDLPTTGWFGLDGLAAAGGDFVRLLGFVALFALIGTTIAVLVRSTPLALGLGLLWFGPVENAIGADRSWALRWFPGRLVLAVLQPEGPNPTAQATALLTLGVYAAVCVAVIGAVMTRRDISA